jgi:sugar phosphate isomerase/epimerase
MKFGICNEIFKGWPLDKVFKYCRQLGYDGVELAPFTIADDVRSVSRAERLSIRERATEAGIEIIGLHWLLVKPEGLYINHTDSGIRKKTSDYLVALVEFCAEVGGRIMVAGSPKQRALLPDVSYSQARAWTIETLRPVVQRAETQDVVVCFEPLGPAETDFINTAEEAILLTQEIRSSAFKIILDVKAMSSEKKPIPQIISESVSHFAHFHANDPNLKGPGSGNVDFKLIAPALKQAGYDDYVSVEVFRFEEGPERIATESLRYLRECFGRP